MMEKPVFAHCGTESPSSLDPERPIIYRSRHAYTPEEEQKCQKRFSILNLPPIFLSSFEHFTGKILIGRQRGKNYPNSFHLYSNNIETLDGVERICYVRYVEETLRVSECSMSRGAHYSSLFHLLSSHMKSSGFIPNKGVFTVSESCLASFLEAANQVVSARQQNRCILIPTAQTDSLALSSKTYYYYKAYWTYITEPRNEKILPAEKTSLHECLFEIEALVKKAAEFGLDSRDMTQLCEADQYLDKLKKKLSWCSTVLQVRINNLEHFQDNFATE